jgi:hypothetical protein
MSPDSSSRNIKNEPWFLHFSLDSANRFICSIVIIDDRFVEIFIESFVKKSLFLYCDRLENFDVLFDGVFWKIMMQHNINIGRIREINVLGLHLFDFNRFLILTSG